MDFLMIENIVELVVISAAVLASRAKLIPFALIIYNVFYQIFNSNASDRYDFYLEEYYNYGISLTELNEELMLYYISNGLFMMLMAVLFALLQNRASLMTACVILLQAIVTVSMSVIAYMVTNGNESLLWLFDQGVQIVTLFGIKITYSSIEYGFVIIYCAIAWMCVFLSRKSSL